MKSALSALRDARREYYTASMAGFPLSLRARTTEKKISDLLESFLTKNGFDFKKINALLDQDKSEVQRISKRYKSKVVKRSAKTRTKIAKELIDRRRKDAEYMAKISVHPPQIRYFPVTTPFLIWGDPANTIVDSHIEPWNSWAKIYLDFTQDTTVQPPFSGEAYFVRSDYSFYFYWQNLTDGWAITDVHGYLVLNGSCEAKAHGGTFAGARYCAIKVDAELYVFEWWKQPPWPSPYIDQQDLGSVSAEAEWSFSKEDNEYLNLFRGCDLSCERILVPPQGVIVIEVTTAVNHQISDGETIIDFANEGFSVLCPFVEVAALTLLTPPPGPGSEP
jgi:hypothetical protein